MIKSRRTTTRTQSNLNYKKEEINREYSPTRSPLIPKNELIILNYAKIFIKYTYKHTQIDLTFWESGNV